MAKDREQASSSGRLLFLTALLGLTTVAAVAFGRVFRGSGTSLRLGLAAALAMLLAWAFDRRHVLLAATASAAGLAIGMGLMVFPETTAYGLPTTATFSAVAEAFRAVVHTAAVEVAPALPVTPLLVAGVTAVWAASFAAHTLAVRAGSPFLALVPPASLLGFAGIVLGDGARPGYVLAFLAASLAVLFADGARRVGRWGPLTMWQGRRSRPLGPATTVRGARRLTVACLGVAVFTPWLLPGFGSDALVDLNGKSSPARVAIDPIVDVRPALLMNPGIELFTVRSDKPSYWRFLGLDSFNGRLWTASNLEAAGGQVVRSDDLDASASIGLDGRTVRQRFTLSRLAQPWLPAAFDPASISIDQGSARYDPVLDTFFVEEGTRPGFTYEVVSAPLSPSPKELDQVKRLAPTQPTQYTRLPPGTRKAVAGIARALTDDQPTPYRKILAIQQHLRTFTYDERARAGHDVDYIVDFLTNTRRGYCEQFAGSMAVLLRALGFESRVAMGFTQGEFDKREGVFRVSTQNAHTWVEVLFPGYGWLAFEPTPTRDNPVADAYTHFDYTRTPVAGQRCQGRDCRDPAAPRRDLFLNRDRSRGGDAAPVFDPGRQAVGGAVGEDSWRGDALRAGLALLMLLGVAIPVSKQIRRRVLVAKAESPRERVLAAYRVLSEEASDVRLGRLPNETLAEYTARLAKRVAPSQLYMQRLARLVRRAAYSDLNVSKRQAEDAVEASRQVIREMRRSVGGAWLVGLFRLPALSRR